MNNRQVIEAWAAKCHLAQKEGPRGQALVLECALLTAMQSAIPDLPPAAKGCTWVAVEWSALGGQEVMAEYCPEDGEVNRVFINGADISELLGDVRADCTMSLDDQAHEAYMQKMADERHCDSMDRAEARAAA